MQGIRGVQMIYIDTPYGRENTNHFNDKLVIEMIAQDARDAFRELTETEHKLSQIEVE